MLLMLVNMRVYFVFILRLYAAAPVLFLGMTVAHEGASSLSDLQEPRLAPDVAGNNECQALESCGNFSNDLPQHPGSTEHVEDVCEICCGEIVSTTAELPGNRNSQGGPDARFQPGQTVKAPFQGKIAVSSQQATELLVSSWNDLSKWAPRNDTSSVCEQHVETAIKGFLSNELWALRVIDSWAKPGPSLLDGRSSFLGNYYQCRGAVDDPVAQKVGFKGNYCVVYMNNLTNNGQSGLFVSLALSQVQIAACLPDTCSQDDVTQLFQERLQALKLTHFLKAALTDCRTDAREYTTFTVIALFLVTVIGTLTLLGTFADIALIQVPHWKKPTEHKKDTNVSPEKSPPIGKDVHTSHDKTTQGVWVKVLLSFSAYTNGRRLMSTSQAPGSISVIPGIRFLNMSWILIGHSYFLLIYGHGSNTAEGTSTVSRYRIFDFISSMQFGVDSFFTISGFLVSYLTIQRVIEKGWGFGWRHFFLHRYWRLTSTFMVTFVLIQGLQRFMVSGSVAPTQQPSDQLACEKNWWKLPLYLNNLMIGSFGNECFGQAWSLAADFQFYLLSPLMMIPFYYNKLAGVLSCLLFIVGQWIVAGVLSYQTNGQITMLGFTLEWFQYCYCPFYSRIAPFTIGVLAGYLLSANKGRVQMSAPTVVIGWVVATTSSLFVIFGFHGDHSLESPSSLLVATIFNVFSRSVWGAALCWVVIACSSGYGGPVNAFLSWSPFTVLGRLTYIGYLVQMSVTAIIFENLEQLTILNVTSVIVFGTVDLIFTCLVSAVLVMCLEFPTLNLERVLRDKK